MNPRFVFPSPLFEVLNTFGIEERTETHATCQCDLGVGEKSYLLRVWNGLLYFTTAPQSLKTPVWTIFSPPPIEPSDAQSLISWWKTEVAAGHFGVVGHTGQFPALWGSMAIWGCNGRGQIRPWWDESGGEAFEWPDCHASSPLQLLGEHGAAPNLADWWFERWQALSNFAGPRNKPFRYFLEDERLGWLQIPALDEEFGQRVLSRARPARWLQDRELEWRRGSLPEYIALARAIFHCDPEMWARCGAVETLILSRSLRKDATIYAEDRKSSRRPSTYPAYNTRSHPMIEMLVADFAPLGWTWNKWNDDNTRWGCERLEFRFPLSAPSFHELLEAQILVRAWLEFLVQNGDIAREDAELLWEWPPHVREDKAAYADFRSRLTAKLKPSPFDA